MTLTEAIEKLEADFAEDRDPNLGEFIGEASCEVPGPVFDALIAVAKAAAEIEFVFGTGALMQMIHQNDLRGVREALTALRETVSDER